VGGRVPNGTPGSVYSDQSTELGVPELTGSGVPTRGLSYALITAASAGEKFSRDR